MSKRYFAGYNSYGTSTVGYSEVHVFDSASARDKWVTDTNSRHGKPVAESIDAKTAKRESVALRTGLYDIDGSKIVYNPNM